MKTKQQKKNNNNIKLWRWMANPSSCYKLYKCFDIIIFKLKRKTKTKWIILIKLNTKTVTLKSSRYNHQVETIKKNRSFQWNSKKKKQICKILSIIVESSDRGQNRCFPLFWKSRTNNRPIFLFWNKVHH